MSEEKPHGASTIRPKDDKGGGAGKWLAGAAIAAVLLGGGYYAWSTYSDSPSTQSAQNEAFDTDYQYDPERAGPIGAANDSSSIASPDESASAAPASAQSAPARTTRRAAATPAAATAAEQTIGITPASAEAAPYDDDEIVVTGARRPIWASTPSARRLSTLYPQRALDRGREGEASLQCTVLENGRLDCVPVSETPERAGFGTAAVRVARTFRHAPQLADGSDAAGSAVNLRVVFRMADEGDRRRG